MTACDPSIEILSIESQPAGETDPPPSVTSAQVEQQGIEVAYTTAQCDFHPDQVLYNGRPVRIAVVPNQPTPTFRAFPWEDAAVKVGCAEGDTVYVECDITSIGTGLFSDTATLTVTGTPRCPTCGNGVLEPGETCDDGNAVSCDGCNSICTRIDRQCGDGIMECGEFCDDGNTDPCDACDCTPEGLAPDIVQPPNNPWAVSDAWEWVTHQSSAMFEAATSARAELCGHDSARMFHFGASGLPETHECTVDNPINECRYFDNTAEPDSFRHTLELSEGPNAVTAYTTVDLSADSSVHSPASPARTVLRDSRHTVTVKILFSNGSLQGDPPELAIKEMFKNTLRDGPLFPQATLDALYVLSVLRTKEILALSYGVSRERHGGVFLPRDDPGRAPEAIGYDSMRGINVRFLEEDDPEDETTEYVMVTGTSVVFVYPFIGIIKDTPFGVSPIPLSQLYVQHPETGETVPVNYYCEDLAGTVQADCPPASVEDSCAAFFEDSDYPCLREVLLWGDGVDNMDPVRHQADGIYGSVGNLLKGGTNDYIFLQSSRKGIFRDASDPLFSLEEPPLTRVEDMARMIGGGVAHELGHSLGLEHSPQNETDVKGTRYDLMRDGRVGLGSRHYALCRVDTNPILTFDADRYADCLFEGTDRDYLEGITSDPDIAPGAGTDLCFTDQAVCPEAR